MKEGGSGVNTRRKTLLYVFLGAVGCIVLYWLLFNTERVRTFFNFLKTLFAPFALGAGLAFILNVPMRAIEVRLQKIKKIALRRIISILLTFIAVALVLFLVVQLLLLIKHRLVIRLM
jgi:predicted PurR-regulated permease PerM